MLHENRVMKNVTISLPEDIARQARIWAAEQDTSVSKFLGQMLTERLRREHGYARARARFLGRHPVRLQEASAPYPAREALHERSGLR